MDYSDSELFIPLDYSFGDSHADDFAGTSTAAGFPLPLPAMWTSRQTVMVR